MEIVLHQDASYGWFLAVAVLLVAFLLFVIVWSAWRTKVGDTHAYLPLFLGLLVLVYLVFAVIVFGGSVSFSLVVDSFRAAPGL